MKIRKRNKLELEAIWHKAGRKFERANTKQTMPDKLLGAAYAAVRGYKIHTQDKDCLLLELGIDPESIKE